MHELYFATIGLAMTLFVTECMAIEKGQNNHPLKLVLFTLAVGAAIMPAFVGMFPTDPAVTKAGNTPQLLMLISLAISFSGLLIPVFKKARKRAIAVTIILLIGFFGSMGYLSYVLN